MDRFMESHFADKKVIYIAADTDRKGLELRKELIARLGVERCRVVEYPTLPPPPPTGTACDMGQAPTTSPLRGTPPRAGGEFAMPDGLFDMDAQPDSPPARGGVPNGRGGGSKLSPRDDGREKVAGCKDANEVLVRHGKDVLKQCLAEAKEIPLEGVFTAKDVSRELRVLFEEGIQPGAETGWKNFDKLCTFELGRLCVVTGIPGSGKSEFTDELVMRLNLRHGWKAAFFSPENMPLTYHLRKLMEKAGGQTFERGTMTEAVYVQTEKYLTENFNFILPEEDFTVDHILEIAKGLVRKFGTKVLNIDPWNRFEHQIPTGQTETQYISAILDKFTNFALRNNCLVILVAHPRKMNKIPGTLKEPVPSLYDINGSAAFFNKCDFGMTVDRDYTAMATRVHIQKVKFRHLGEKGEAVFKYNTVNGRYTPCEIDEQTGKAGKAEFDNEPFSTVN